MKSRIQQIYGVKTSRITIYVSVEIFLLIFCVVELKIGNPHPKDKPPLVCPHILLLTKNDAPTQQFNIPLPLALRVSGSVRMPLMYCIKWTSLDRSLSSGACNVILKNAMAMQVSGRAHFVAYKFFAT